MSVIAYIGLGSNMGDKTANCQTAVEHLAEAGRIVSVSSFYYTEPVGYKEQEDFINAVAGLETNCSPSELLSICHAIEDRLGRRRTVRWGPRTVDLDILLFGDLVVNRPDLIIPHPLMALRRFVLAPLVEIAPAVRHPVLNKTMIQLLGELQNSQTVMKLQARERSTMTPKPDIRPARYIVTEGPIGVGKTSLTMLLAEELGARLILEQAEENPFLTQFYKDPSRYRFQTQMFFLLSRFSQQQEMAQPDLFSRITISDYLFDKDRIFAYVNLDDNELPLYEQFYKILEPKIVQPDLVIFLQADTDTLLRRIKQRGRSFEKEIGPDYIAAVNEAYNQFFFRYTDTPLLVINTSDIDFVHRREDLDDLLKQILGMKQGTQYYVPRTRGK